MTEVASNQKNNDSYTLDQQAPLFSIIIPSYNRAGLILETLQSVFIQTCKDYEILIIDDCSTDNTQEILQPYAEKGILRYYRNEINRERAYSRNKGLEYAKGSFVTFLDSDDLLYDNCLQDAAQYIRENPKVKMFHCLYEKVDMSRNKKLFLHFPSLEDPYKALCQGNFLSNIGVFIHKDLYKSIKLDETPILTFSEDYDYYLRILVHTDHLGRINKVGGVLREHNLRSTNTIQAIRKVESVYYLINKNLANPDFVKAYKKHIPDFVSYLYLYLGAQFSIGGGGFFPALQFLLKALKHKPARIFQLTFYHHLAVVIKYQLKKI